MNMDYIVTHLRRQFVGCACVVHKSVAYIYCFHDVLTLLSHDNTANDTHNLETVTSLLII
jgi:hypothetical protein